MPGKQGWIQQNALIDQLLLQINMIRSLTGSGLDGGCRSGRLACNGTGRNHPRQVPATFVGTAAAAGRIEVCMAGRTKGAPGNAVAMAALFPVADHADSVIEPDLIVMLLAEGENAVEPPRHAQAVEGWNDQRIHIGLSGSLQPEIGRAHV